MTLDDAYISSREAVRRGHEDDWRRRETEYQEERLVESIEAREAYWQGVMEQMPQHVRDIRYSGDVTS